VETNANLGKARADGAAGLVSGYVEPPERTYRNHVSQGESAVQRLLR
jgi:hypothetical protein